MQANHSHLPPVVPDERRAVAFDDESQLGCGKRAVCDPVRQLTVPHAVVPAQHLTRAARKVRNDVRVVEREVPRGRLRRVLQSCILAYYRGSRLDSRGVDAPQVVGVDGRR